MKKQDNIIIVQARQTSKRLPNKVLKKIGTKTICEIILKRLKKCKLVDKIVFAIPNNKSNHQLKKHLYEINANVFLGSEDNVLKRVFYAAKKFNSKNVIRITADCPLVDPVLIDDLLIKFNKHKLDYVNNAEFNGYSDGLILRFLNLAHLKQLINLQKLK